MSNNQTSWISQKNRTSLKRELDRPGEQNIWIQTPWWFSSSVSTQRGFHAWWCVLACNGQHTKYFPNMFLTKWRGVKWWGACKAQWRCKQNSGVRQTNNKLYNQPKQTNRQTCRAQGQCKQSWDPRRRCRAAPREGGTLPCEAWEKCTSLFKVNSNCPKPDIGLRLSQSLNQCQ